MALAVAENVTAGSAGATNIVLTLSSAPENDLLVSTCMTKSATLTNPTGFTTAVEVLNGGNADILRQAYKVAGASEDTTPEWTGINSGDGAAASCRRITGAATASPLDQTASDGYTAAQTSQVTGTTGTLAQADEIAIGAAGLRESVTSSSVDSSFVGLNHYEDPGIGNIVTMLDAHKIVAATTAISATFSWTGSAGTMGLVATYKAIVAIAATPIPFRGSFGRRRSRYGF
jgi:hypothetical protein